MRSRLFLPWLSPLLLWPLLASGETGGRPLFIPYGNDFVPQPGPPRMKLIENPYRLIVFLNFDGATLGQGPSHAPNNTTDLITSATLAYPAFAGWARLGGREKGMAAVLDELRLLFMKMAVEFVTVRPPSGDYTMALIGGVGEGVKSDGPAAVGVSPLDCQNSNKNDVALIFGDKLNETARSLAYVVAHELGHSFGLEHVEDQKSIMSPALTKDTCCWTTSAVQPPPSCGRTQQDDERVLLENLGAGPGDTTSPLVWFLRPGPGAVLPPNFSIEAAAVDDLRIHHVVLLLDGVKKLEVPDRPYAAFFSDVADGEHTLRAEAFDWKPNTTAAEITVTVEAGCTQKGSCSSGKAAFNAPCGQSAECGSGLCALKEGSGRCTMSCQGAGSLCPAGTTCEQSGERWLCTEGSGWTVEAPAPAEPGCSLSPRPGKGAPALPLAMTLPLLLLVRGRRVRSTCPRADP